MVERGDSVTQTLAKEFGEEALASLKLDPSEVRNINTNAEAAKGLSPPPTVAKSIHTHPSPITHSFFLPIPPSLSALSTSHAFSSSPLASRLAWFLLGTQRDQLLQTIQERFRNGVTLYEGYCDDPRNTDNAWLETVSASVCNGACAWTRMLAPLTFVLCALCFVLCALCFVLCVLYLVLCDWCLLQTAVVFHDDNGTSFEYFDLEAGDDAGEVSVKLYPPPQLCPLLSSLLLLLLLLLLMMLLLLMFLTPNHLTCTSPACFLTGVLGDH